jgi:hypothetical protein
MRDQLIIILRDARSIQIGADCNRVKEFANNIEVEAMAALHGGKHLIPSNVFGEIPIPQDVITAMSNGDDDMWFNVSKHIDCNVFYADGWQFNIYPVKNGDINMTHELEHGKL